MTQSQPKSNEGASGDARVTLKVAGVVGVADDEANSYASLQDFQDFIDTNGLTLTEPSDSDERDAARSARLMQATEIVDGIGLVGNRWIGNRASAEQALAWPRTNARFDGTVLPQALIPSRLMKATCVMAVYLIRGDVVLDKNVDYNSVVNMEKAGPVEVRYAVGEGSRLGIASGRERFNYIEDLLGGLLYAPEADPSGADGDERLHGAVFNLSEE